jgi:uncharacterized protein (DUF2062 family)
VVLGREGVGIGDDLVGLEKIIIPVMGMIMVLAVGVIIVMTTTMVIPIIAKTLRKIILSL